jgi:aryl-alcohol dehydrogenase-like predicted oxidoreductase
MEKRRLGKTEHMSSISAFGGAAFWQIEQSEADVAIELVLSKGVNHFDVAPLYGQAEMRIGSWLQRNKKTFFLACKTRERGKTEAWGSLKRSLETLKTDHFDLFQLHGVDDTETLNVVLGPGGALEAVLEAKEQGLVRHIGITGHRPYIHIEALNRFDFDTVMFPLNRVHAAHRNDWNDYRPLLEVARRKDAGVLAIKSIAKQPWERTSHLYRTWYEPFDNQEDVDKSLRFTLSQDITSAVMPGEMRLWPVVFNAAERFKPMSEKEQREALAQVAQYQPLVAPVRV